MRKQCARFTLLRSFEDNQAPTWNGCWADPLKFLPSESRRMKYLFGHLYDLRIMARVHRVSVLLCEYLARFHSQQDVERVGTPIFDPQSYIFLSVP